MSFQVVEDSLDTAREEAIAVLDATRRGQIEAVRFDWLYRDNPDGQAVLWAVRKVETGEMAGFTVALPRRMIVDGQMRTCWNGADFSMKPKFRTLGLAMKLRRAAKEGVDGGRVDFLYAHPNEKMALIHSKVGHSPVGRMLRYAKVLRTGPYIEKRAGNRLLAAAMGAAVDPVLRLAGREFRHRPVHDVQAVDSVRFDDRYDGLFEEAAGRARIVGVRDADYLNWRYADNPLYETRALEARDGNRLRGYLLYTIQDDVANIKDIFPPGDGRVARDLIAGMIRKGRKLGLKSLSVATLEGNPVDPYFAEFGFRRRPEISEMFAYASPDSPWCDMVLDGNAWFLTVGDRDV